MSDDNDCSGSESAEFLKGKKKTMKKITKLGKRPYNKGKINAIKYQSNCNFINKIASLYRI